MWGTSKNSSLSFVFFVFYVDVLEKAERQLRTGRRLEEERGFSVKMFSRNLVATHVKPIEPNSKQTRRCTVNTT
jgi:hypothetical protein